VSSRPAPSQDATDPPTLYWRSSTAS